VDTDTDVDTDTEMDTDITDIVFTSDPISDTILVFASSNAKYLQDVGNRANFSYSLK
jgi:hypothetical protein